MNVRKLIATMSKAKGTKVEVSRQESALDCTFLKSGEQATISLREAQIAMNRSIGLLFFSVIIGLVIFVYIEYIFMHENNHRYA